MKPHNHTHYMAWHGVWCWARAQNRRAREGMGPFIVLAIGIALILLGVTLAIHLRWQPGVADYTDPEVWPNENVELDAGESQVEIVTANGTTTIARK